MRLRRREVIAGLGGALAAAAVAESANGARPVPTSVAGAASNALAERCAPGLVVALGQDRSAVAVQGFGLANLETATSVEAGSVFRIGSLTKQFTAAAALKLAERGQLELDAPVEGILPAFAGQPAFSLREAMHHTAGLHSADDAGPLPGEGALTQVQLAELIARQPKLFDFDPGTAWLYSNANYIVLGAAIEASTKMPFDAAIHELLLGPLGLRDTAVDRQTEVVRRRVNGYVAEPEGVRPQWTNAPCLDVWQAGGAGAMRSTAGDLVRWHQQLLTGKVVDLRALLEPGRLRNGRVSGSNRFSVDDAHYGDVQYAAGLLVSNTANEPRVVQHYGFISGFSALLETELDRMRTLAVLLNADPGPHLPFRTLRKAAFA